tara:strand:+ start:96 stop:635 length:540 start_codon:yes stop_codon:yes gene_type:complete
MNNLSNIFLINMPHLNTDPIFGQSIIYICEHNKEGAMGLIINKPLQRDESIDILEQIGLAKQMVYFGGPVSPEKGFILHDTNYQKDETLIISNTAGISYSDEVLSDIKNGSGPNDYRLIMGYSGWDSGQLEKEIENGDWMITPSSKELIFSKIDKNKWNIAIKNMNINFNDFSGQSGLA